MSSRRSLLGLTTAAALALIAAHAVATPARAEPALPEGFAPGGAAHPMPAAKRPGKQSLAKLRERSAPARRPTTVRSVRLSTFPVVEVEPLREDTPKAVSGPRAEDVIVDSGGVSIRSRGHGLFKLGWLSASIAPQRSDSLSVWHFRGGDPFVRAEWVVLRRAEQGLELDWSHGWFGERLEAILERSLTTPVATLVPDVVFAFRTRCARCAGAEKDVLRVVVPGDDWGGATISMRSLPVAPGLGRAMVERFGRVSLRRLQALLPSIDVSKDLVIGVESTQAMGEAEPTILVHVAEAPPEPQLF